MSGNEPIMLVSFWLSWLHNGRLLFKKMVNSDHFQDLSKAHYLHQGRQELLSAAGFLSLLNLFSGAMPCSMP
jgi:hypothetical protein